MLQAIQDRVAIQRIEDLHRLANRAERGGVRILATRDGAHFATSEHDLCTLYQLTDDACDCNLFHWFGKCPHHALFLSELGRIPDAPQADIAPGDFTLILWNDYTDAPSDAEALAAD